MNGYVYVCADILVIDVWNFISHFDGTINRWKNIHINFKFNILISDEISLLVHNSFAFSFSTVYGQFP